MNTQETRTETTFHYARATAAFLLVLIVGYTFTATPVESAIEDAMPATTSHLDFGPGTYFPAQYTNQGTGGEEHIQAY